MGNLATPISVRKLQRALHTKAKTEDNLRCVAGEWAGFDRQWLKERILSVMSGESTALTYGGFISVKALRDITKKEWARVCNYLPNDYRAALLELVKSDLTDKKINQKSRGNFGQAPNSKRYLGAHP